MEIKIASSDRNVLTEGKVYIGSGAYRDERGVVWSLVREGDGWTIRRLADKNRYTHILKCNGRDATDITVVPSEVTAYLDTNPAVYTASVTIVDNNENEWESFGKLNFRISMYRRGRKYIVVAEDEADDENKKVVQLPEKISSVLEGLEDIQIAEVFADMLRNKSLYGIIFGG